MMDIPSEYLPIWKVTICDTLNITLFIKYKIIDIPSAYLPNYKLIIGYILKYTLFIEYEKCQIFPRTIYQITNWLYYIY